MLLHHSAQDAYDVCVKGHGRPLMHGTNAFMFSAHEYARAFTDALASATRGGDVSIVQYEFKAPHHREVLGQ